MIFTHFVYFELPPSGHNRVSLTSSILVESSLSQVVGLDFQKLKVNYEKTEFGIFLRAKRPIFKLRNITLNGINPQTNLTYMQNLRFLHWMVWPTACRQTWKNGFWHVFCARSAHFLNYKKITHYGINPHTNMTYMQNLRFLHWTVWRTACGQTWKTDFSMFFARETPNF